MCGVGVEERVVAYLFSYVIPTYGTYPEAELFRSGTPLQLMSWDGYLLLSKRGGQGLTILSLSRAMNPEL